MKYKLINSVTKKETICDKVTIDGFDYYVGDVHAVSGDFALYAGHITKKLVDTEWTTGDKKVIATNNPNIDIPKVVDEVKKLAESIIPNLPYKKYVKTGFIGGYNKFQETHPFSEEDLIGFAEWCSQNSYKLCANGEWILLGTGEYKSVAKSTKELLEIWKEQKPKIVYYE